MDYLIIALLTLLSCLIFDNLGVLALVRKLSTSYKSQLNVMQDKTMSDENKQKELLRQTPKQLAYLAKLIGSIVLFISPFILIVIFEERIPWFRTEVLYSLFGILISLVAVFLYILLKKQYVKLFKH